MEEYCVAGKTTTSANAAAAEPSNTMKPRRMAGTA